MAALDSLGGSLAFEDLLVSAEIPEPYVLSWRLADSLDGDAECCALVLMKRTNGMMLVLPGAFLPEEVVERGNRGEDDSVFGPSSTFAIPSVILDGGSLQPTGESIEVMVIDCLPQVVDHLRTFAQGEEIVYNYDEDSPFALPSLDALHPAVQGWLAELPHLAEYYSAEEGDLEALLVPDQPTPTATPKASQRQSPGRLTSPGVKQKTKKPTVATLAEDIRSLMTTLPTMSSQLATLARRQEQLEAQVVPVQPGQTRLSAPLGSNVGLQPQATPTLGQLANSVGRPPRTTTRPALGILAVAEDLTSKPLDLLGLEEEKPLDLQAESFQHNNALAAAVLQQSRTLTALVAQIAGAQNDPMSDLTMASSSTSGTKGTLGRARLQAELSAHKGTFFNSVMQAISRRMAPTSPIDLTPEVLASRGISGLKYLERFGGYSRQRELGQLQYQVMTAMDFLAEGNVLAAKDTIALLAVTIEQACLDGGKMDLACLLCLQEDPPISIFQNRALSTTSRSRAFAPLADQKWITVALAFLKEMEVITTKRNELATGGGRQWADPDNVPTPKPKPKGQPKKKGRGKGSPVPEETEGQ